MPTPPRVQELVPTSQREPVTWRYTTDRPADDWWTLKFDDHDWNAGPGGFGTRQTPGAVVRTRWNTRGIWLRRSFQLSGPLPERVGLRIHHDEDVEVYLNGLRCLSSSGFTTDYELREISTESLRVGGNQISVVCHQSSGGQYIDIGLDAILP